MIFREVFFQNNTEPNQYFYIRQAGMLHQDPEYYISRTDSETGVIGYVSSGCLLVRQSGQCLQIDAGQSFILPSHTRYELCASQENPPVMEWLNIRGAVFSSVCQWMLQSQIICSRYNAKADLARIIMLLQNEGNDHEVMKVTLALLTDVYAHKIWKGVPVSPKEQDPREKMDTYISNCIQQGFSVQKMAKDFYMSVDALNRQFKRNFAMTPYQYYQAKRIGIAENLLKNTELPIEDIANRLHFTDRNYFTLYFKQRTGDSPGMFRKREECGILKETENQYGCCQPKGEKPVCTLPDCKK